MTDFFKSHPSLWNYNTTDYRHRNLRDSLLEKLVEEFDNKFKKKDIKQEWHSLQVSYKREKAKEERSKTSGAGCSDVYCSTWDHFSQMEFLDDKKRKEEKKEETNAKMQLWKSLTESLKSKILEESTSEQKSDNVFAKKTNLFGKVVADTLFQYELKSGCI